MKKAVMVYFLFALASALPFAGNLAFAWQNATSRVIEVIADKDSKFKVAGQSKPVLNIQSGETVTLRVTSHFAGGTARDSSVHSLVIKKLRDQGWDLRLKEGTQDFTVVAPKQPGEYVAECTVLCGRGHDDMKLKIIVTDAQVSQSEPALPH
jgi:heme/copper-type cytochrome/quinol oxidase subunit 2